MQLEFIWTFTVHVAMQVHLTPQGSGIAERGYGSIASKQRLASGVLEPFNGYKSTRSHLFSVTCAERYQVSL